MNIQSAVFNEDDNTIQLIMDTGQVMSVPVAKGNRHYQMIQDWVAKGNTISPYVVPPVPPAKKDKQKLEQRTGLTIVEIKAVLGII